MSSFFDALEPRKPAVREAALLPALPGQIAHAQSRAPAFADILAGVDAPAITTRAALAKLPVTRKHELLERQKKHRSEGGSVFGGFSAIGFGPAMPRVFASPGPIYEPEGAGARLLAHGPRHFCRGLSARRADPQQLQLPLRAGRLDDGNRRACAGLHRVPGRHRADRAAGAGHGRTAARRLYRHPELPADHCREGRRDGRGPAQRDQGHVRRRGVPAQPARLVHRAWHRRLPVLRHRRPRPDRLRNPGARRPGA